jgi:hypothetical protein
VLNRKILRLIVVSKRILGIWIVLSFVLAVIFLFCLAPYEYNPHAANQEQQSILNIFAVIFLAPLEYLGAIIDSHKELIGAIATVVIGWFTFTLWNSTDKMWREAQEASKIATRAANAAQKSADIAYKTVMPFATFWISRVQDLPLFMIETNTGIVEIDADILISVGNAGKTRAEIREFRASLFLTPDTLPEVTDFSALAKHSVPSVIPGETDARTSPVGGIQLVQRLKMTHQELRELLAEGIPGTTYRRFFLVGRVIYDDAFDMRHTDTFVIKIRYWRPDGRNPALFQMPLGSRRYNQRKQEPIPDPDPLDQESE